MYVPVIFELMMDRDECESDSFTRVYVKAYYLRHKMSTYSLSQSYTRCYRYI